MTVYVIRDWATRFEVNRTRELKRLDWLPLPNYLDSDEFCDLIEHRRGPAHFGVWIALVLVASRCNPRGVLIKSNQTSHDFNSLSRLTRIDHKVIAEAIERLLEIGLLQTQELSEQIPHPSAVIPHLHAPSRVRDRGEERRGEEKRGIAASALQLSDGALPLDAFFEGRYSVHPKKGHRASAERYMSQIVGIETAPMQAEFARVHDTWICSEGWVWKGGARAPFLDEWIADQGYRYPPPASEEPIANGSHYLSMAEQDELVRRGGA